MNKVLNICAALTMVASSAVAAGMRPKERRDLISVNPVI